MKGRGNYLCRHRWEEHRWRRHPSGAPTSVRVRSRTFGVSAHHRSLGETTETGDRAELHDLPENVPSGKRLQQRRKPAWAPSARTTTTASSRTCGAVRLNRMSSSSTTICFAPTLRCGKARMARSSPPAQRLWSMKHTSSRMSPRSTSARSVSAFRVEDLVRDGQRLLAPNPSSGRSGPSRRRTGRRFARAPPSRRPLAPLFSGLAPASPSLRSHAGAGRARPLHGREPVRSRRRGDGARRCTRRARGHLGLVGSVLRGRRRQVRLKTGRTHPTLPTLLAALQRRSHELAMDLRFLIRADDPDFVYYVESRGRDAARLFLRASPIDVSRIVQEALFDRMRATY